MYIPQAKTTESRSIVKEKRAKVSSLTFIALSSDFCRRTIILASGFLVAVLVIKYIDMY